LYFSFEKQIYSKKHIGQQFLLTFFDIFAAKDKKSCSHFAWTSLAGVGY
jgi:hypothetical protein